MRGIITYPIQSFLPLPHGATYKQKPARSPLPPQTVWVLPSLSQETPKDRAKYGRRHFVRFQGDESAILLFFANENNKLFWWIFKNDNFLLGIALARTLFVL